MLSFSTFDGAIRATLKELRERGGEVDTGHWQGVPTAGKPDLITKELLDVQWSVEMHREWGEGNPWTNDLDRLRHELGPNLPWADDHFAERVSRVPSNPGTQYMNWPWWTPDKEEYTYALEATRSEFKFTHTYQERYWPKFAYDIVGEGEPDRVLRGIRYDYGDLDDLVSLLLREPYTRQAWLPIFFPEDTGAVHQGRVPCTLGYHFMLRDGKLHLWYIIRSCDAVRHFRDDLYLSARLLLWVLEQLQEVESPDVWDTILASEAPQRVWKDVQPGTFHFHCFSLHYHKGDEHLLKEAAV